MGIVSYIQLAKVNNTEEETSSLKEKSTHFSSLITKLNSLILLSDFVLENKEGIYDYYITEAMMISQEFDNTKEGNLTEKELALISQAELCFERIDFAIEKYIMIVDDDQERDGEAIKIYEESTNLIRLIDFIEEHIDTELKQAIDNSTEAMQFGKTVILSLSILATLLGIVISIIITVIITRPLNKVKTATESIALGDLDYHLDVSSNDEIGDLAKSFNGMVQDLKTTRNLLVKEKKSTENIITSMHDILIVLNAEGKIKKINDAGCKLLHYSLKDLLDQYMDIILKKKNFHKVTLFNIIRKGSMEEVKRTFITSTGIEIPVNLSASVMYNADEDIEGIVCVAQDITERQRYEKELASIAKFPAENVNGVIRISNKGEIIYSNDPGLIILDYWKRKVGELLPEVYSAPILSTLKSAKRREQEIFHNERTYDLIITPISDFDYINIYANDITTRKEQNVN
ncbi:MAG: PAS domain S-box protein [Bacteroidia bacterium]|nr:PAS domain S-box protein [Bacteroidia bacterium]